MDVLLSGRPRCLDFDEHEKMETFLKKQVFFVTITEKYAHLFSFVMVRMVKKEKYTYILCNM